MTTVLAPYPAEFHAARAQHWQDRVEAGSKAVAPTSGCTPGRTDRIQNALLSWRCSPTSTIGAEPTPHLAALPIDIVNNVSGVRGARPWW